MKHYLNPGIFFILLLCLGGLNTAYATGSAGLFLSAPSTQVEQGKKVTVDVKIQSPGQSINAISGAITFPEALVKVASISKDKSIVNLWTKDPTIERNKILFEGVILNPGFQGSSGLVFRVTFEAQHTGTALLGWSDGAILANDGLGTNILNSLKNLSLTIIKATSPEGNRTNQISDNTLPVTLSIIPPVITSISPPADPSQSFSITGKGTPNALTKIEFQDVTEPSLGVKFVRFFVKDRTQLADVELKNDNSGIFSYVSPKNLVAGVYNAVPSYQSSDKTESIIGYGIKVFIKDNTLNQILIVIINALVLIIPITALILIIIFLPWYFRKRLHIMNKQLELEEEKIGIQEKNLAGNKPQ